VDGWCLDSSQWTQRGLRLSRAAVLVDSSVAIGICRQRDVVQILPPGRSLRLLLDMFALPKNLDDLIQFDTKSLTVSSRESKQREYKEDFLTADLSDYTKTLAAFGNANGGYILFGISNKPRQIVGVNHDIDEAQWVDRLKQDFDPEIPIALAQYAVGQLKILAVGVDQVINRPVVCKRTRSKPVVGKDRKHRDVEVIREGSIYYRYAGQTRTIGYSELTHLIAEREERRVKAFMDTINVIQKVGVDRAGILKMSEESSSIFMTPDTARSLALIDKGRLVQKRGDPAYVVVGNVEVAQVIHTQLPEEDKNLPSEAATILRPTVQAIFGPDTPYSPSQVTLTLQHLGLDGDNIHSVQEKKLRRKFVTRAGIQAIKEFIEKNPVEAITAFGSKASIARFKDSHDKQARS
jgi:hypothetical protein